MYFTFNATGWVNMYLNTSASLIQNTRSSIMNKNIKAFLVLLAKVSSIALLVGVFVTIITPAHYAFIGVIALISLIVSTILWHLGAIIKLLLLGIKFTAIKVYEFFATMKPKKTIW